MNEVLSLTFSEIVIGYIRQKLQGRVKFPIGGKPRKPFMA